MSDSLKVKNIYPCSIQNSTLHPLLFECCIVEKKYCLMETMFVQLVSISLYHGRQSQLYSLKEYSTNGIYVDCVVKAYKIEEVPLISI